MEEQKYITITLEEYKELLIIKGKYEELCIKSYTPITTPFTPMTPSPSQPWYTDGYPYKVTAKEGEAQYDYTYRTDEYGNTLHKDLPYTNATEVKNV